MRANRLSVLMSPAVLLGPWLVQPGFRQHHAHALALASVALTGLSLLLKRPSRAEHAVLPVLLAVTCPDSLVRAIGLASREPLVAATVAVLSAVFAWRILAVARQGATGFALLEEAFPQLVPTARAEVALFWFGVFRWRRHASDVPADAEAFPATGTGTELAMCWLTASGLAIEMPMMHLLLAHVGGSKAAWACTGLHALLAVYLVGYAKSVRFRPTLLFADRLEIRVGIVARRVVKRAAIETAAVHDGARDAGERLFGLDKPNVRIGVVGRTLLLRVDAPKRLVGALAA